MSQLLSPKQLHDYQKQSVIHLLMNQFAMLWLGMGLGKALEDNEPVLTPVGWIPIRDITPGDYVIGSNGKPTQVLGVYPQGVRKLYKVQFNDEAEVICDGSHIWAVNTDGRRHRGLPEKQMTTDEILEAGVTCANGKNGTMLKWSIPLVAPVEHCVKDLPIDPYLLGAILGDAWISEKGMPKICTDIEMLESFGISDYQKLGCGYVAQATVPGVCRQIRQLGLAGKKSWEKYVPEIYLRGSIEQRLALLQGLLDTDGSPITCGGGLEFSSTSEKLIDAVVELTQSLGGVARKSEPRITSHQGGEGRVSWRVNVKLPSQFNPFRLSRKLDAWIRPTKYHALRKIKSITPWGESTATCIMVDAPDHLYVTRNHVLTHNTVITLTAMVDRKRAGQVQKVLIFGPLRVIQAVWEREAKKWEHTKHLRFSVIHGSPEKRLRAMFNDADVYLCNYENMNWLAQQLDHYYLSRGLPLPYQMVIYDEVSKLKNSTSLRVAGGKRDRKSGNGKTYAVKFTGWRKILHHFIYRVGLTGTPASNGYIDLHGQYLAVDGGQRLGEFVTHFRDSYFTSDYNGWKYTPTQIGKQWIEQHISDITLKMDAKDYLDLPAVNIVNMMVDLPEKAKKHYQEVEQLLFTTFDSGREIELFSKSSVSNKCLQICNGTPYVNGIDMGQGSEAVHDAKLQALESILEEAAGKPVLCSYSFVSDAERIMKKFSEYKPVNLTKTPSTRTEKVINDWNAGKIRLMIGHPASMGHGIDGLQEAGSIIVWFGMPWSLELYDQMNARLDRQGQRSSVSIIRILCRDTIDLVVADAIERKTDDQEGLKAALERYRDGYTTNDLEVNFY